MTLRDQLATDLRSVLNTDEFGESFTYIPKSGHKRTVVGDVVREVVEEENGRYSQRLEKAIVTVGRDSTNEILGGINQPARGDRIILSDGAEFAWQQTVQDIDPASWVLEFHRADLTNQGNVRQ